MPNLLSLRKTELTRRVRALPNEVGAWYQRVSTLASAGKEQFENAHFSQVQALRGIVTGMISPQNDLLNQMDPAGDVGAFTKNALILMQRVVLAQQFWDYFWDKLGQRISEFEVPLWIADTVAFDCYSSVIRRAINEGILTEGSFREPPLTYVSAETSPLTWLRSQMPMQDGTPVFADGSLTLPFPVIELPREQMENLWELMALHHEIGHDLEKDLGIQKALQKSLDDTLVSAAVAPVRINVWQKWRKEIFADFVGLQLGGPAFAVSLASLVLLPADLVLRYKPSDPHPTHYLRIRLCAHYIAALGGGGAPLEVNAQVEALQADAKALNDAWLSVYGNDAGPDLTPFLGDFDLVIRALMDTVLAELKGKTVRSLMPYDKTMDDATRAVATFMTTGFNPPGPISPRHVVSAAQMAAVTAVADPTRPVAALEQDLQTINTRLISLVRKNAPPGLRAGGAQAERKKSWAEVGAALLNQPFHFQNEIL